MHGMKPALLRLALTLLSFILGCHATAVRDAARSASLPAGVGVSARTGRVASLDDGGGAPAGYFASTTGSATGAGTIGDPWTLTVALAGGFPAATVQPGDTVWIRGGTYTGLFRTQLSGSAGHEIVFRAYPGERVTIDGNNGVNGNGAATFRLDSPFGTDGRYLILRDVEIMNSRVARIAKPDLSDRRNDGVFLLAPHSKVINCVLHDNGEGLFLSSVAPGWEAYGNLIYYNGDYAPFGEQEAAASIDLVPSSGSVSASGAASTGQGGASPLTFSHNNTGDYTIVAARQNSNPYSKISVTFDGTAMTLLNGKDGYSSPVAIFGLAGHAGTHNVVVTGSPYLAACAQSFSNVGSVVAGGTWSNDQWHVPPFGATTTISGGSPETHLVVDGISIYGSYSAASDYAPSGDNSGHMLGGAVRKGNPKVRMSWAAGAASVNMAWNWTPDLYGHGHGMYIQSGGSDTVVAVAGNNTVNWTGSPPVRGPWRSYNAGAQIRILGAGPAGADLVTTIASYTNNGSIKVTVAPSTSVASAEASWGHPAVIKDNIIYDEVVNSIQVYGSSGAAANNMNVTGNLHVYSLAVLGGLTGFRMTDSVYDSNYTWSSGVNVGYHMNHLRNFAVTNNYLDNRTNVVVAPSTWDNLSMTGNTFVGATTGFTSTDFPTNTYSPAKPVVNKVVVRPNTYEANRANIYVYNWENLPTVDVDLSSAVAVGTPINIMNAQDYYNAPVYSGVYAGGTVALPMTGLTVAPPWDRLHAGRVDGAGIRRVHRQGAGA